MADARVRLSAPVRIFLVLTGAEAAALGRWHGGGDVEAIRALTKIRTALDHAIADAATPAPTAAVPPLRAKTYQSRETTPQFRPGRATPLRMAKAGLPAKTSTDVQAPRSAAELDDYVPFRDEANGIYT